MATSFTDPTITAGSTRIRKVHIDELRAAIDAERVRRSLSNSAYTDPTITQEQTAVRDDHVTEIRSKITNFSSLSPSQATLVPNTTIIKQIDIEELRTKVNALESHPMVGGSTDCNSSCTGLCVGCTGTCTGGCTSCTGCTGCTSCSGCTGGCTDACRGGCYSTSD